MAASPVSRDFTPVEDLISRRQVDPVPARLRGLWDLQCRLGRVRLAVVGEVLVLMIVALALLAPVVSPYDPLKQDFESILAPPSPAHWLGTDDLGRDMLTRVIFGARVSLKVGLLAASIGLVAGVLVGLIAGYFGKLIDQAFMRLMDALMAFPVIVLALAITAGLGPGLENSMIAVGVTLTPLFARLVRGQVLSVRELDFVLAAQAIGARSWRIMLHYVLPNVLPAIIVQATIAVSQAILAEAGLSFLGMGVQPPTPSWGSMLQRGFQYQAAAPWTTIAPGLAIMLTILALNFVGDGLRDALDPYRRGR